ncbi:hypothetical protein PV11_02150 [Exophiala sideris]|uniref:Uncharacterized protein n=1 Tax=Exophiala sideris TaxID=1016849 RepID=A0A0D1YVI7_9EURO|nr:hypothetical protein PV11_02150 [Exophiala sideris]
MASTNCSFDGLSATPQSLLATAAKTSSLPSTLTTMTTSEFYDPDGTTLPSISIIGYATAPSMPPGSTLVWITSVSYKSTTSDQTNTRSGGNSETTSTVPLTIEVDSTLITTKIPLTIEVHSTSTTSLPSPVITSSPSAVPSITSSCSTTSAVSISLTQSATPDTTVSPTASPSSSSNSTAAALTGNHARIPPHILMIAIPVSIGSTILLICLFLLWRRFHASSFQKFISLCPYHAALSRWAETRDRNRRMRALRTAEGITQTNRGFTGGDTYTRRLRQYEQESMRAKGKFSFETPSTPLSGKKSEVGTLVGSPWRKNKIASPKASYDYSRGPETGRRMYGPFKRDFNEETGSLESWEEKWFNLGTDADESASSSADLPKTEQVKDDEDKIERVAGPGMSWRKLI